MGAPKGNDYYKLRLSEGRDRIFEEPDEMAQKADEYFQWCLDNPFEEQQVFHSQGKITKTTVEKLRPFTLQGLCNFIGMHTDTFNTYKKREGFYDIYNLIRQIIDNQQYEGAASGLLNASIIARRLGLVDKSAVEKTVHEITPEEREARKQELLEKAKKK
jgi:hypothetical protein